VKLEDLIGQIPDFNSWGPTDRIRLFAWHIHTNSKKERFSADDIRDCFDEARAAVPNVSSYLRDLLQRTPRQLLKDSQGHFLERSVRGDFDKRFGNRPITVEAIEALRVLPLRLPNLLERAYLEEALRCFQCAAFRASAVMCWNVAYDHLCAFILQHANLAAFNAALKPKSPISTREDFHDQKERQVLEACRAANVYGKNEHGVYLLHLETRNRVAHASGAVFLQPQAEAFILDLVNNGILKL
jgi:hypothetical protein